MAKKNPARMDLHHLHSPRQVARHEHPAEVHAEIYKEPVFGQELAPKPLPADSFIHHGHVPGAKKSRRKAKA